MLVAAELYAVEPVSVQTGKFVEICLWVEGGLLPKSMGRAEYHITTMIGSGSRVAATGRLYVCQFELATLGLGTTEAMPPVPVAIKHGANNIIVRVRTNLFLTIEEFRTQVRARSSLGEKIFDSGHTIISPKPGLFDLKME